MKVGLVSEAKLAGAISMMITLGSRVWPDPSRQSGFWEVVVII